MAARAKAANRRAPAWAGLSQNTTERWGYSRHKCTATHPAQSSWKAGKCAGSRPDEYGCYIGSKAPDADSAGPIARECRGRRKLVLWPAIALRPGERR